MMRDKVRDSKLRVLRAKLRRAVIAKGFKPEFWNAVSSALVNLLMLAERCKVNEREKMTYLIGEAKALDKGLEAIIGPELSEEVNSLDVHLKEVEL